MSSAISPTSSATTGTPPTSRIPVQALGQEDFLKLLVAQMTSQDPLNPQTDTQFISQMAQFSALEQAKSTQAEMAQMRADQALIRANTLLGRTVTLQVGSNLTVQGAVSAVEVEAGMPKLVVDGKSYDLDQVITISPGLVSTSTSTSASTLDNYARISQLGR